MNFYLTPYSIASGLSTLLALFVFIIAYPRRNLPGGKPLMGLMTAVMIWSGGAFIEYGATDLSSNIFWAKIQYIGVLSTPLFYLALVLEYYDYKSWLRTRNIILLSVIPTITLFLTFSNEWHYLIWDEFTTNPINPTMIVFGHGPGFWIGVVGYSYALLAAATFLLLYGVITYPSVYKGQIFALITAALIPWVGNMIYLLGLLPIPGYEPTSFLMAFAGLFIVIGIFRYKLLNLIPIALLSVVKGMHDAVFLLDMTNKLVFLNPVAQQLLGNDKLLYSANLPVSLVFSDFPEILNQIEDPIHAPVEIKRTEKNSLRYFTSELSDFVDSSKKITGHIILVRDTTLQNQIHETRQQQAVIAERERMAQELHDNLGQVLSFISLSTESIRDQIVQGNYTSALSQTGALSLAAQNARMDVQEYILDMKTQSEDVHSFCNSLKMYLARYETITNMHVSLSLPMESIDSALSQSEFLNLLRIIQESLANARKHSKSSTVNIIFTLEPDCLSVVIADDGIGFDLQNPRTGSEGFGLDIMRKRAAHMNAEFEIRSNLDHGTQLFLRIKRSSQAVSFSDLVGLRVLVVDDHPLFVTGLTNVLVTQGISIIGTANNGDEAIEKVSQLRPDMVLLDVHLPGPSGTEIIHAITEACPDTQVVMLSLDSSDQLAVASMNSGARGYLLKSQNTRAIFQSLVSIRKGEIQLAPELANNLVKNFVLQDITPYDQAIHALKNAGLSDQQIKIFEKVTNGKIYKEIATEMHISESAIKYHIERIENLLNISSRSGIIAYAISIGLAKDRRKNSDPLEKTIRS